jgi:hypothetical protein
MSTQFTKWGNQFIQTYTGAYFKFGSEGAPPAPNPLLTGLIAYWKLDETAGTVVTDSTGYHNLVNHRATINQTGILSKCYDFVKNSSTFLALSVDTSIRALTNALSIAAWVKNTMVFNADDGGVVVFREGTTGDGFELRQNSDWLGATGSQGCGAFELAGVAGANMSEIGGLTMTNDGNWHLLVGTFDGATQYLYTDGVCEASVAWVNTISYNAGQAFYVGTRANWGDFEENQITPYVGSIDEPAIWNRALTPTEVSTLYNNGTGKTYPFTSTLLNNLVSYWKLDDAVDSSAIDSVGTVNGAVLLDVSQNITGKLGTAYSFHTNNTLPNLTSGVWLGMPSSLDLTTTGTINAWIWHPFADWDGGNIFGDLNIGQTERSGYGIRVMSDADGIPRLGLSLASASAIQTADGTRLNQFTWYMLTASWDTSIYLYVNGVSDASVITRTITPANNARQFCIGRVPDAYTTNMFGSVDPPYTNGIIDELSVWSRRLTPTEVSTLYNNGIGKTYPFS